MNIFYFTVCNSYKKGVKQFELYNALIFDHLRVDNNDDFNWVKVYTRNNSCDNSSEQS